ncbi:hydrogenase maturation nickel metallochaperone HypA [Limisphaera ngatamarikiensis]|jgi:hydrogenase nickel incorporation protein HypA/HybF|uniref:Hydrogenase maturation factor HypA n=1 Tax=Limisphaera ngatamarikiensis TaxID=1324935 RepID=A0A6M1RP84_9BACT|nr:hydrogenase maturation nickel metallochaperone HypA [Limisphaera ngatamarikiensis]NGO38495.1 hydrogenase maturation nickel metallochaperone HypA [Limisphaera ngatamarikiensis]
MHEVGLMSEAVEIALREAQARGARRITALRLRVGTLSGVVPEALSFAFDLVTARTAAEGARLEIESVPAVWRCVACGREFGGEEPWPACPHCGGAEAELRQGRELEIASIDLV